MPFEHSIQFRNDATPLVIHCVRRCVEYLPDSSSNLPQWDSWLTLGPTDGQRDVQMISAIGIDWDRAQEGASLPDDQWLYVVRGVIPCSLQWIYCESF
eukprot:SAG31_NODE_595_length_13695_cov_11.446896_7_plen_98_part_00